MQRFDGFYDEGVDRKRLRHGIEAKKISQGVFDDTTLMTLYELSKKKAFDRLTGLVSQGKEANVYHGVGGRGEVAVKIYCVDACDFRRMSENIASDPRFSVGKNRRRLVYQWAQREYKNLRRVSKKVSCPKPFAVANNVLVMGFVGRDGVPAPKLKDASLPDPAGYFAQVVEAIKGMYSCGIVHGDLSEYNILDDEGPVAIDFSMGVTLRHFKAETMLARDVENITKFFRKRGVDASQDKVLFSITSK